MYKQGEIVIVPFPFTDLSDKRQRPVLILSKEEDNKLFGDVVTCGITSNLRNIKYSVLIDNSNLKRGIIPKKSRIKVNKLFTLDKRTIIKSVARINMETFEKVKKELYSIV